MSASEQLDVDRLRVKFPRAYKALVQLYPSAWDEMLRVIEPAMEAGKTASVVTGQLSILRGLERATRKWVMLCLQADRREIMLRQQTSFLTQLHDKSLDDILAELNALEGDHATGAVRDPPNDGLRRGYAFISHHSKSAAELAATLADTIESLGFPCWIAPRDIGSGADWNEEVYGAAQRCSALVLLFSQEALKSRHVKGEVHIAVARDVPVFVVKLADDDPAKINVGLATYQHVDWIGRAPADAPLLARQLFDSLRDIGDARTSAA